MVSGKRLGTFGEWWILKWVINIYYGCFQNRGTPNHPFLMGFSIINHPFWGTPIFGNIHIIPYIYIYIYIRVCYLKWAVFPLSFISLFICEVWNFADCCQLLLHVGTPDLTKRWCFTSGTHRKGSLENLGHVSSVPWGWEKNTWSNSVLGGIWDGFWKLKLKGIDKIGLQNLCWWYGF